MKRPARAAEAIILFICSDTDTVRDTRYGWAHLTHQAWHAAAHRFGKYTGGWCETAPQLRGLRDPRS